uniref:Peptidase S1 domain-containing protein n=1 Tax=Anopheles minimus TaxID=112268 RepID=A0A2C9H6G3_9DIPT
MATKLCALILLLGGALANGQSALNGTDVDWTKVRFLDEFDEYWARLPEELQQFRSTISGPASRISSGLIAVPGQFPYQVILLSEFTVGTVFCGGTVLTNSFILTTAHCVTESVGLKANGGLAIMGAYDRIIVEPAQQRIRYNTAGITIHPGYSYVNLRNDIATVLLNTPITYSARIQPVRLPDPTDQRTFATVQGTVTGFGRSSTVSTTMSRYLRYTFDDILSNSECSLYWSPVYVDAQNVCLNAGNGRSPCIGDSGGPLLVDSALGPIQVGIVSFGEAVGCAVNYPSIFVRITHFLPWILDNSDY